MRDPAARAADIEALNYRYVVRWSTWSDVTNLLPRPAQVWARRGYRRIWHRSRSWRSLASEHLGIGTAT